MTTKSDFTREEWDVLQKTLHEPGVAVMLASPGGVLREVWAVLGGLMDAADDFAESELVQQLLQSAGTKESAMPQSDKDLQESWKMPEQRFMDEMIRNLRQATKIVQAKAAAQEFEAYKQLVISMAERVAKADRERGSDTAVTADEQRVLDEIKLVLNRKG